MKHPDYLHQGQWFLAEFIGALFLAATVGVTVVGSGIYPEYQGLFVPLAVGSIVGLMAYVVGPVSGGHFNPAVSFGLFLIRKLSLQQLLIYIIAQFLGALVGFQVAHLLIGGTMTTPTAASTGAMLAEFVGAFLLVFTVIQVTVGKIPAPAGGLAVAMALTLGVTLAAAISGGLLNPALALALGAYHVSYLLMPLLGGAVAAGVAAWLNREKA